MSDCDDHFLFLGVQDVINIITMVFPSVSIMLEAVPMYSCSISHCRVPSGDEMSYSHYLTFYETRSFSLLAGI